MRVAQPQWKKKATFEELSAATRQRPIAFNVPHNRSALEYFESFEAAWLKQPFEELTAHASIIQKPTGCETVSSGTSER